MGMVNDEGWREAAAQRADIGNPIIILVLLTSLLGAWPGRISLGGISMLGLLSGMLAVLVALAVMTSPAVGRVTRRVVGFLLLFWLFDLAGFAWQGVSMAVLQDNVIWAGFLFTIVLSAHVATLEPRIVQTLANLKWLVVAVIIAYMLVDLALSIEDAAVPLLALWATSQLLADWRLRRGLDILALVAILFGMALLGARITLGAVLLMYFFIQLVETKRLNVVMRLRRGVLAIATILVLFLLIYLYVSQFRSAFLMGDQALTIGGITINTSGRWYWWNVVYSYAVDRPFLGWGMDVPVEMESVTGWAHPHNDYLRIFHHLGLVGLVLWVLFYYRAWRLLLEMSRYLWAIGRDSAEASIVYSAFLFLSSVAITMVTDNTIVYSFVMYPLGVYVGLSLGIMDRYESARAASGAGENLAVR